MTHRPGDTQIYVVEQPGRVVAVTDEGSEVVLDITDRTDANGEQGLLGLAFHPTADLAYVNYIDSSGDTVVAEFPVDPSTGQFDPASFREVLTVDQPYSNHNGGKLAFGPDGCCTSASATAGPAATRSATRQNHGTLLGKILRIDPSPPAISRTRYPPDNPFVGGGRAPSRRSGRTACATRGGSRSTAPPATSGSATSARAASRRSTTARRRSASTPAKGVNYGWSAVEGYERFNRTNPPTAPSLRSSSTTIPTVAAR